MKMTYEGELFVDFVVRGLDRAASIHLDALRWISVIAPLLVGQQVVFCEHCVPSDEANKVRRKGN